MAYAPTDWADGVTPVDEAHLDKIEQGIFTADSTANKAVPKNGVTTAVTPILQSRLLAGDAQPAYRSLGDGRQEWGPGGATLGPDTFLYRAATQELRTDGVFRAGNSIVVDQLNGGGKLYFGSALDTFLYRSAAGILKTDLHLQAGGYIVAGQGGATQAALGYTGAGVGPGVSFGSALDTNLYRAAAGVLKTDGGLEVGAPGVKFSDGSVQTKAGTDLSFDGDWVAGTYQEGDTVVKDGIVFVCVGGPTSVAPDPTLWGAPGSPVTGWVPVDGAVPAATRMIANKLLAADAQPAFRTMGDGKHEWGAGGASVLDTNLYRAQGGVVATDGRLRASDASVGFHYFPVTTGGYYAYSQLQAASQPLFRIGVQGTQEWGPGGSTAPDTTLYRFGAGFLRVDGLGLVVSNEVYVDFASTGKKLWFGGAADTGLYRHGAAVLRIDGRMWATSGIITFIKAGAINDGDFGGVGPIDGTIAIDVANGRLYYRAGGAWRYLTGA